MTSIGSTNSYYASSVWSVLSKNGNGQGGTNGGEEYPAPKQSQASSSAAGLSGSDTVFGSKLAGALWSLDSQTASGQSADDQSMEAQGVAIDQTPTDDTWLGEKPSTATEDEFMSLANKTFAERIREQYLKDHGMTEDDLKAMSPDDRAAVEAEIKKAVLEAMGVNGKQQATMMSMGSGGAAGEGLSGGGQGAAKSSDPAAALLGGSQGAGSDDEQFGL